MAKVRMKVDKGSDIFLHRTKVENLFISEYLPDAPGDYVKVFLFGLMYAQYELQPDRSELAKLLGLSEDEIAEAWIYWESRGLVRIVNEKDDNNEEVSTVIFISKIHELYGKTGEPQTAAPAGTEAEASEDDLSIYESIDDMAFDDDISNKLIDRRLRELYDKYQITTGRTISRQEISKIEDAVKVYGIEPDIFSFAIDYCADLEKYSIDYIFKVALRWTEEGCRTVEEAKKLLDKHSRRNDCYRQVFKALGFNRLPAPIDREIMDKWFDVMNCSLAEVLDACSAAAGIREPNLKYVNKVIENRRLEKGGVNTRLPKDSAQNASAELSAEEGSPVSRKVLADYYEFIRNEDEKAREARIMEVLRKVPKMKSVFEAESSVNSKMLSLRPGADNLDARQRLRAERIAIEESRKQLLSENGFPGDYLTRKYRCSICKDTGYTDEGMVCSCCRERAAEAYKWHTNKEKA